MKQKYQPKPPKLTLRCRMCNQPFCNYTSIGVKECVAKKLRDKKVKPVVEEPTVEIPPDPLCGSLYFVQCLVDCHPIKVGLSGNPTPLKRFKGYKSSNPFPMECLGYLPVTGLVELRQLERKYHETFSTHRMKGEWFYPHPDILKEIQRLKEIGLMVEFKFPD